MKTYHPTTGRIVKVSEMNYHLLAESELVCIPKTIMHGYVKFDESLIDHGQLKIGSIIQLMKIEYGNGRIAYYPDHRVYEVKNDLSESIKESIELLEEFSPSESIESYMEKLSDKMPQLKSDDRLRALTLLKDVSHDGVPTELLQLIGEPQLEDEHESVEYKSSLAHTAFNSKFKNEHNGQLMEVVMSIAAIANTTRKGRVVVGVKDKRRRYEASAIEEEIATLYPNMSLDSYLNTVLANFIRSYTGSDSFMQGLRFKWMKYQHHLILLIDIDFKGDIVLCNVNNKPFIPYRVASSTHCVSGYELVEYIRNHSVN